MSKRRISTFSVAPAKWMKYRPYEHFTAYDGFYLRLANEVFEELNDPQRVFRVILQRENIIELSVVLVSWFEDYANEIGLWAAFIRKNKDLYGYALPFYSLKDYDPEAINPEDIAYLCWHYCSKAANKFISPDSPGLMSLGYLLLEKWDKALDEAPGTDFYEEFLSIDANIQFFDLKFKLNWMALKNYLIGPEFNALLNEEIADLLEKRKELLEMYSDPNKLLYTLQDDFLYKKSSSYLAFTAPDWLAEVVKCPDRLRADIRRLFQRVLGEFDYEGKEGAFYLFRHQNTKRLFKVRQESVDLKGIKPTDIVYTTLVNWQGEWWVTGTVAVYGSSGAKQKNADKLPTPGSNSFYAWSASDQQIMRETAADLEAVFLEFFGDRMVLFKNDLEVQQALKKQTDYYNQTKSKGVSKTRLDPNQQKQFEEQTAQMLKEMNRPGGIALFFEPGEGTYISPVLPGIVKFLAQEEITDEQARALFFTLFNECSPATVRYLLKKYGSRNLRLPGKTGIAILPHLEFLMRFYNPGDFREVLPNNSLMKVD